LNQLQQPLPTSLQLPFTNPADTGERLHVLRSDLGDGFEGAFAEDHVSWQVGGITWPLAVCPVAFCAHYFATGSKMPKSTTAKYLPSSITFCATLFAALFQPGAVGLDCGLCFFVALRVGWLRWKHC
jgi:hypothetical protein